MMFPAVILEIRDAEDGAESPEYVVHYVDWKDTFVSFYSVQRGEGGYYEGSKDLSVVWSTSWRSRSMLS
jgi:hypothetical protein